MAPTGKISRGSQMTIPPAIAITGLKLVAVSW